MIIELKDIQKRIKMPGKRKYSPAVGSEIDSNESNVPRRLLSCCCISVLIAIAFATLNIVGGFSVTGRILGMFKKND